MQRHGAMTPASPSMHAVTTTGERWRGPRGSRAFCVKFTIICAHSRWCRSPRQGVLVFNNDYHFRVHQISHCGPHHSINRTEASHQGCPGGPASRSRGCNGDTCHPCPTPCPCSLGLPVPECPPVATCGPCPALPCPAIFPLSGASFAGWMDGGRCRRYEGRRHGRREPWRLLAAAGGLA